MKIIRNIARRPWPRIGGWLPVMMLICGVLASCSSEDESTAPLPDGKYPLQLTAEVAQPQTRAGGKDCLLYTSLYPVGHLLYNFCIGHWNFLF